MNLQGFLDYRNKCPLCDADLVTSFHSNKKQSVKWEDNRMLVIFRLDALKKKQIDYKVGYSFGLKDNSWYVEFYTKDDKKFENDSPDFLRARFKELDKNLGTYRFYRHCAKCVCYNYMSNTFILDYKGTTGDLTINLEYIGMHRQLEDRYRLFKLSNDYILSKSTIVFGKTETLMVARDDFGMHTMKTQGDWLDEIQTSLIKFTTKEETMDRIQKLIVFS